MNLVKANMNRLVKAYFNVSESKGRRKIDRFVYLYTYHRFEFLFTVEVELGEIPNPPKQMDFRY